MTAFAQGWKVQIRVIKALMIRELTTRYGRENIGFLWVMIEPILFAGLVGTLWRFERGPLIHGVSVFAFVATGYLPLVLFRTCVNRAVRCLSSNSGLLYHRQVKILDLIIVRFLIEFIGHLMAYLLIGCILYACGLFPAPHDMGMFILGWIYYSAFSFSLMLMIAPVSETSEILEKFVPVTTYMMIPFSGTFVMTKWLEPHFAHFVSFSPPVHGMEMMRYGIFGDAVDPVYDFSYPLWFILPASLFGLYLCRRLAGRLIVE